MSLLPRSLKWRVRPLTLHVLLLALGCGPSTPTVTPKAPAEPTSGSSTPSKSQAEMPDGWKKFSDEGFSVSVPSAMRIPEKPSANFDKTDWFTSGKQWEFSQSTTTKTTMYMVEKFELGSSFIEHYRRDPKKALSSIAMAKGGASERAGAESAPMFLDGVEGLQTKLVENTGRGLRSVAIRRLVVKDTRAYNLTFVESGGTSDEDSPAVKTFFDSFRIE